MAVIPLGETITASPKVSAKGVLLAAGVSQTFQPWANQTGYVRVRRIRITCDLPPAAAPGFGMVEGQLYDGTVRIDLFRISLDQYDVATSPGLIGTGEWDLHDCIVLPTSAQIDVVSSGGNDVNGYVLILWETVS